MGIEERIFTVLTAVQSNMASLKISQADINARLDKIDTKNNMLEVSQATINSRLEKLASNQAVLYEKADKLESKVIRLEAGQTYMNRKLDSIIIELTKLLKNINENQDTYKEQIKIITTELESLSGITKENMFAIAQLKHKTI